MNSKCSRSQSGFNFLIRHSDSDLENWRLADAEKAFSRCCDCIADWFLDYKTEIHNNLHGSVAAALISLMQLEL